MVYGHFPGKEWFVPYVKIYHRIKNQFEHDLKALLREILAKGQVLDASDFLTETVFAAVTHSEVYNIYHMTIQIKRVYEPAQASDGKRILVDRLWPRGMSKEKAKVDLWLKDIAPSTDLRKWFDHDPAKWNEFKKRYHVEIKKNPEVMAQLADQLESGKITLVYGASDEERNNAVVLKEYLEKKS